MSVQNFPAPTVSRCFEIDKEKPEGYGLEGFAEGPQFGLQLRQSAI